MVVETSALSTSSVLRNPTSAAAPNTRGCSSAVQRVGTASTELEEDVGDIAEEGSYRNTVLQRNTICTTGAAAAATTKVREQRESTTRRQRFAATSLASSSFEEAATAAASQRRRTTSEDAFWHGLGVQQHKKQAHSRPTTTNIQLNHQFEDYTNYGIHRPHNNNINNNSASSSVIATAKAKGKALQSRSNNSGGGGAAYDLRPHFSNEPPINPNHDTYNDDVNVEVAAACESANIEATRGHGVSPAGSTSGGSTSGGRLLPNVPKRFVVPRISAQEFKQQQRSVSFEDENNAVTHLGGLANSDSNGNSDERHGHATSAKEAADLIDIIGPAPDGSTPCSTTGVSEVTPLIGVRHHHRTNINSGSKMVMDNLDDSDDVPFYQRDPSFFVAGLRQSSSEDAAGGVSVAGPPPILDTYSSLQRPSRYAKERASRRDDYTRQQEDFVNTYGTYRPHNSRSLMRQQQPPYRDRDRRGQPGGGGRRPGPRGDYNNFATSFEDEFNNFGFHPSDRDAQAAAYRNNSSTSAPMSVDFHNQSRVQMQQQDVAATSILNATNAYLDNQRTNNVILPPTQGVPDSGMTPGASVTAPYHQQQQQYHATAGSNAAYQASGLSKQPPQGDLLVDDYRRDYSSMDQSGKETYKQTGYDYTCCL